MPLRYCDEEIRLRSVLRERRARLSVRQADVARAMGWRQGAVSKCEQGEKLLGFLEAARLCRILSLDAAALVRMCRGGRFGRSLGRDALFRFVSRHRGERRG